MKNIAIFATAIVAVFLSGCNKSSEDTMYTTLTGNCYSLISSDKLDPMIVPTKYSFNFELVSGKVNIKTDNLNLTGISSFSTGEIPFYSGNLIMSNQPLGVYMFEASTGTGNNQIKDIKGLLSYASWTNVDSLTNKLSTQLQTNPLELPNNDKARYASMNFKVGEYEVSTFWPDMLFCGSTITSYGVGTQFVTNEVVYRVHMNLGDAANYTADLYMYNAKFTDKGMPSLNFVLKDLPIVFTSDGYKISATDINPVMVGEGTPNTMFPFTSLILESSNCMREIKCRYTVMNKMSTSLYEGTFNGTGLLTPQ